MKQEDLVIADGRQRAGEELEATLGVQAVGIFSCHVVLDKLERCTYTVKTFYKNEDTRYCCRCSTCFLARIPIVFRG